MSPDMHDGNALFLQRQEFSLAKTPDVHAVHTHGLQLFIETSENRH
jgi:hypothetical protein